MFSPAALRRRQQLSRGGPGAAVGDSEAAERPPIPRGTAATHEGHRILLRRLFHQEKVSRTHGRVATADQLGGRAAHPVCVQRCPGNTGAAAVRHPSATSQHLPLIPLARASSNPWPYSEQLFESCKLDGS